MWRVDTTVIVLPENSTGIEIVELAGVGFSGDVREKRRSKLRDLEVRTSNRIVGSHIAIGSTKHLSRHEREFARVGMDIRIAFITRLLLRAH